jgi:hypothetical protein
MGLLAYTPACAPQAAKSEENSLYQNPAHQAGLMASRAGMRRLKTLGTGHD